jgi:hypothetical protein
MGSMNLLTLEELNNFLKNKRKIYTRRKAKEKKESKDDRLFATSFFRDLEDHEKKKSMGNTTRRKRGGTTYAHMLVAWWVPSPPSCVLSTQSWSPQTHLDLKPITKRNPQANFATGRLRNTKYTRRICRL